MNENPTATLQRIREVAAHRAAVGVERAMHRKRAAVLSVEWKVLTRQLERLLREAREANPDITLRDLGANVGMTHARIHQLLTTEARRRQATTPAPSTDPVED